MKGRWKGSEEPAFASYGAAAFARAKTGEGLVIGDREGADDWMAE